jgi:hypothetical protein
MRRMILVAGHAVPYRFDRLDTDEGWYLKHFQTGEGALFAGHVRLGVEAAARDGDSLLVFAGGQTDAVAGPRSEGQGYWLVAEHMEWFGQPEVRERSTTEEFSMDSFENLLFGLCRFRELTGAYPERVTAVGWAFKGPRFDLHREAVCWPASSFEYLGAGDPPNLAQNIGFERARAELFRRDPYGAGEEAAAKRANRNFSRRQHGYHRSAPELAALLDHRGPQLFGGDLPWRHS